MIDANGEVKDILFTHQNIIPPQGGTTWQRQMGKEKSGTVLLLPKSLIYAALH